MGRDRGTAFPLLVYEMLSGYDISPTMWPIIRHCTLFQTPLRPAHLTIVRRLEALSMAET